MIDAAIIGLGRWGKNIVTSVQGKSKRLRFIRGRQQGARSGPRLRRQRTGSSCRPILPKRIADPRVKAVFLATPHSLHVEQIAAVAAAGKPVWCEKPLALTRAEAAARGRGSAEGRRRVRARQQQALLSVDAGTAGVSLPTGRSARCCMSRRISPTSIRPACPGGWRDDPRELPGGGLTGAGLHLIDALVNLAGPIATVDAQAVRAKPPPDPRDVTRAAWSNSPTARTGQLATVRAAPAYWRVHVFGTKGWAEARDETMLTIALVGQTPETSVYPASTRSACCWRRSARPSRPARRSSVSTDEMLDVVGAFEAIIRSMGNGRSG